MLEVQLLAVNIGTGTVTHPAVLLPLRAARDAAYPDTEHEYTPLTSVVSVEIFPPCVATVDDNDARLFVKAVILPSSVVCFDVTTDKFTLSTVVSVFSEPMLVVCALICDCRLVACVLRLDICDVCVVKFVCIIAIVDWIAVTAWAVWVTVA